MQIHAALWKGKSQESWASTTTTHAHTAHNIKAQLPPSNTSNMHAFAETVRSKAAFLLDHSLGEIPTPPLSAAAQQRRPGEPVHKLNQANHPREIQSLCNTGILCGLLFNNRRIAFQNIIYPLQLRDIS